MLTVKHIDDHGRERIVSVHTATFVRDENKLVGLDANGVAFIEWTAGRAYVMNDNGKTVAVYNISTAVGIIARDDAREQLKKANAATIKQEQTNGR